MPQSKHDQYINAQLLKELSKKWNSRTIPPEFQKDKPNLFDGKPHKTNLRKVVLEFCTKCDYIQSGKVLHYDPTFRRLYNKRINLILDKLPDAIKPVTNMKLLRVAHSIADSEEKKLLIEKQMFMHNIPATTEF